MDFKKPEMLLTVARLVYHHILRDIIVDAVNNPESEWDDGLIFMLDTLFTKIDMTEG